jgi:tRNA (guanosine-2'-O-)-methyltransferase
MLSRREKLIQHYYNNKIKNFEILVDNIWDPHNVSAISRSCDGFGIKTVNLYYTYNKVADFKKIGKASSSSSNNWIEFNSIYTNQDRIFKNEDQKYEQIKSESIPILNKWAKQKKAEGFKIVGSSLQKISTVLHKYNFSEKTILVLGNEKRGISPEMEAICDEFIYIPMVGMVESYNVSVAAAVILYEAFKQKGTGLILRNEHNLFGQRD